MDDKLTALHTVSSIIALFGIFGLMKPTISPAGTEQKMPLQSQHDELRQQILVKYSEHYPSFAWRPLPLRVLAELRQRWKILFLAGLPALVLLPVWLIALVVIIFPRGRTILWSLIKKISPLEKVLIELVRTLHRWKISSTGISGRVQPLIYQPEMTHSNSSCNSNQLAQQLSPQSRLLLLRLHSDKVGPLRATELPERVSLHRSERSILKIVASETPSVS